MSNVLLPYYFDTNKDWDDLHVTHAPCGYSITLGYIFYPYDHPGPQNRCDNAPHENGPLIIGPFPTDMDIISGGVHVDDDISFNGEIYEPGLYVRPGDSCNGEHGWDAGHVFGLISQGDTLTIQAHDQHGGTIVCYGYLTLSIPTAP